MSWPLLDAYKRSLRESVRTVFRVEPKDGELRFIPIEKIVDVHYGTPIYTVAQDYYPREGLILLFLKDSRGNKTFMRYERNAEEGYLEEVMLGHDLLDLRRAGVNVDAALETLVILVEEKAAMEYTPEGVETTFIPTATISLPYSVVQANPEEYCYAYINELFVEGEPETRPLKDYDDAVTQRFSEAEYAHLVLERNAFLGRLRERLAAGNHRKPYRIRLYWKTENARHASAVMLPAFRDFLDRLGVTTHATTHTFNVAKVKRNRRLEFDITEA